MVTQDIGRSRRRPRRKGDARGAARRQDASLPAERVLYYAILYDTILYYTMLCYAMLCHAMLCYAMLCYAMLCYNIT